MNQANAPDGDGLGRRLLEREGLQDAEAMRYRREAMREILAEERAFTARIRRACLTAWSVSLLLPLGFIAERPLLFLTAQDGPPTRSEWVAYIGTHLLIFIGGFAAVIGVITLVAWLFRTRTASVASLQLRVGDLETELAALSREREGS